jgi:hypothetical protein
VQIGTGEKNSLSSELVEESKRKDLAGLLNTLKVSARGCLSRRIARRALHSLAGGERRRNYFLRSLSEGKSSGWIAPLCAREDSAEAQKSQNPLRIQRKSSGGLVLSAAQSVTARSAEATEFFDEFRVPKAQEGQHFHMRTGENSRSWSSQKWSKGRGL